MRLVIANSYPTRAHGIIVNYKLQMNVILYHVQRAPTGKTELLIMGAQPCTCMKQASFWQFCESPTQQQQAPNPRISVTIVSGTVSLP